MVFGKRSTRFLYLALQISIIRALEVIGDDTKATHSLFQQHQPSSKASGLFRSSDGSAYPRVPAGHRLLDDTTVQIDPESADVISLPDIHKGAKRTETEAAEVFSSGAVTSIEDSTHALFAGSKQLPSDASRFNHPRHDSLSNHLNGAVKAGTIPSTHHAATDSGLKKDAVVTTREPLDEIEKPQRDLSVFARHENESLAMKIADGIGSLTYEKQQVGSRQMNRDLRERIVMQDKATLCILFLMLFVTVIASALGVYQFSDDPSPVTFYSDPKYGQQRILCSSANAEGFLQAFNIQPQTAWLRLVGRVADPTSSSAAEDLLRGASRLLMTGRRRMRSTDDEDIVFDVSLDLSLFVSGEGILASEEEWQKLQNYLVSENPLEVLLLRKTVIWDNWEDVAMNIRHKLRSQGFEGDVEVRFDCKEELRIFRNHPWQNFARAPVTQLLAFVSCVGLFFWVPYLYARTKYVKVESQFRVNLDMNRYWELLSSGLHVQEGFQNPSWIMPRRT
jgi:hypothetical protein